MMAVEGFGKVGGINGVAASYSYAISSNTLFSNTSCGVPTADYFDLHRGVDKDLPWPGENRKSIKKKKIERK